MADRTSAELFSDIFQLLANDEPVDRKAMARELYKTAQAFDFSWYQMYCDEALIKLGLAREGDDGVEYLYEDYDETDEGGSR